MFFSLATHPPLEERIRAIDPQFDGKFPKLDPVAEGSPKPAGADTTRGAGSPPPIPQNQTAGESHDRFQVGAAGVIAAVGLMESREIDHARQLIARIPVSIQQAKQDTAAARAVILALVFDRDATSLLKQMNAVKQAAAPETARAMDALSVDVRKLPAELRLPVLEMMIPVLYQLPPEEYENFLEVLNQCIHSDDKVDFWEFTLLRLIRRQVGPRLYPESVDRADIRHHKLQSLRGPVEVVLNFLVRKSAPDPESQEQLLVSAREALPDLDALRRLSDEALDYNSLDDALEQISHAAFALRKSIISACYELIAEDGKITIAEAELLRLLAIAFDCPMAPLHPEV